MTRIPWKVLLNLLVSLGRNVGEPRPCIAFLPVSSFVPKSVMKTLASVPAFFLSPVFTVTENVVDLSAGRGVWRSEWHIAPPMKGGGRKCTECVSVFMLTICMNRFTCSMCCPAAAFSLETSRRQRCGLPHLQLTRKAPSQWSCRCLGKAWNDCEDQRLISRSPGLTLPRLELFQGGKFQGREHKHHRTPEIHSFP